MDGLSSNDKYNIERFVKAQDNNGFYSIAVKELRSGQKRSHWIWFILPCLKKVGNGGHYDAMYGISSLDEAKAYLAHPLLSERLYEVCEILLDLEGLNVNKIFGITDAARVQACMTLFYLCSKQEIFGEVLDKYFGGKPSNETLYALNETMPPRVKMQKGPMSQKMQKSSSPHINQPSRRINRKGNAIHPLRKLTKIIIVFVLFFIIGIGCYYLFRGASFALFSDDDGKNNDVVENLSIHAMVKTSDNVEITYHDLEKYNLHINALLSGNEIAMDSLNNAFVFQYDKTNGKDSLRVTASIEDCQLCTFFCGLNDFEGSKNQADTMIVLNVSQNGLRIYEELLWYETSKTKMKDKAHEKYIVRIQALENADFKSFLDRKLQALAPSSSKKMGKEADIAKSNQKNESKTASVKTINDEIPFQILSQIQRGRFVNFNMDELSHEQKYILIRYNHACKEWSRSEYMTHSFLYHELRRVETYRDLEYAIHRLEAEIRRKDKRKG